MSLFRAALRTPLRSRSVLSVPRTVPRALPFFLQRANFAAASGLSKEDIQTRVLDVMKSFEKVDPAKVCG